MEIKEKFLPIGTVCLLKGGTKRVMITGFCSISNDEQEKMYDYSGCMYPEGVLSSDQTALFDHDQIERVDFYGLIDDEEKTFKKNLNELLEKENLNSGTKFADEKISINSSAQSETSEEVIPAVGPGLPGFENLSKQKNENESSFVGSNFNNQNLNSEIIKEDMIIDELRFDE
ncbi:MAG: DUF4176 domain-containing protein [bacterium]|nr:DUF4176 domain-containing protein [bacterium]